MHDIRYDMYTLTVNRLNRNLFLEICAVDVDSCKAQLTLEPCLHNLVFGLIEKIMICWSALQKVCCHHDAGPCTCKMQSADTLPGPSPTGA